MTVGTIQNREAFLNKIANQLGRPVQTNGVKRPELKHNVHWEVMKDYSTDELITVLKERCKKIHTDVVETTKENLHNTLNEVIVTSGGGPIVIGDDKRFAQYGVEEMLNSHKDLHIWNQEHGEQNRNKAAAANIGIVFSEHTLAESGTITVFNTKHLGRAVSFLPNHIIAIIDKKTIVPRITQATAELQKKVESGKALASSINFISGPSNSADIEMNLVVGVHGPIRATYIIV